MATLAWTSVECADADEALLTRVGASNSSNISMAIGVTNGRAFVIDSNQDDFPPPRSIRCHANDDDVLGKLRERFPHTLADTVLVEDKKTVTHLLKHRGGDYIAIGDVMGAFCMWTSWYYVKSVPADVMQDILTLAEELFP